MIVNCWMALSLLRMYTLLLAEYTLVPEPWLRQIGQKI